MYVGIYKVSIHKELNEASTNQVRDTIFRVVIILNLEHIAFV